MSRNLLFENLFVLYELTGVYLAHRLEFIVTIVLDFQKTAHIYNG